MVLRCTAKLPKKMGAPVPDPPPPTTVLGDWYGNTVNVGHQRMILLISEHSRIAVVMPARDTRNIAKNFPAALRTQLSFLGIPENAVERELSEMKETVIAKTNSRTHLGTLNDFANMMWYRLNSEVPPNLDELGFWLSGTPLEVDGHFPCDKARTLFGAPKRKGSRRLHLSVVPDIDLER